MKSPNILFIQADQIAQHSLVIYGNPASRAQRLYALPGEGAVFKALDQDVPWYRGVQGYNESALDHEPDTGRRN